MSKQKIKLAGHSCYLLFDDNTYQSSGYDLNVGLFVGVDSLDHSPLSSQRVVVLEKARYFENEFSHWPAAVVIASVVPLTDACVKATNTAKTLFSDHQHFWYYWHIDKYGTKTLKGKLEHKAFKGLAAQMSGAHYQVSIAAFCAIWDGTVADPEFAAARDYSIPTWGGDKVQKKARCFQLGVFTQHIVSTQLVDGILHWTKEGWLNRLKDYANCSTL